jgi:cell division septation protein DedD
MADEGLREIQLNGKQLVFLFMAATVVAVVIFLCGVMVGRGVRVLRANELGAEATDPAIDPTAPPASPVLGTPTDGGSRVPLSPPDVTYGPRLGVDPPDESLDEGPSPRASAPVKLAPAKTAVPKAEATPKAAAAPKSAVGGQPAGSGFVVQVAAVPDRRQADAIASRLAGKGYPSFVTPSGTGSTRMFRVRVGKYSGKREAQAVAVRLQKEEQFKPWITR